MKINDCTEVTTLRPWRDVDRRLLEDVHLLLLHRIHLRSLGISDQELSMSDLGEFFYDRKNGTGGRFPYHFVIFPDGEVCQGAPLEMAAPGAVNGNSTGVQVAVVGDFRKDPPTKEQVQSTSKLCGLLLETLPNKLLIDGHTAKPGRTNHKGHLCPGQYLVPALIKMAAKNVAENIRLNRFRKLGGVL